jgi:hypothetical protein
MKKSMMTPNALSKLYRNFGCTGSGFNQEHVLAYPISPATGPISELLRRNIDGKPEAPRDAAIRT